MGVFNGVFPIRSGKEEDARTFAAEAAGTRRAGLEEHLVRSDVMRETWSLQETPMGSLMLVWFEGDVQKAFADLATDTSDYTTWFRSQVLDITGVDLGAPPDGPPPAVLVDYQARPVPASDRNDQTAKLFLHHPVADFEKWRPVYDSDAPRRDAAGLTNVRVLRDADDPSSVWLVADGDASSMEGMLRDPTLAETMQAAGVTARPELFVAS